jgi:HEAT repeat protein
VPQQEKRHPGVVAVAIGVVALIGAVVLWLGGRTRPPGDAPAVALTSARPASNPAPDEAKAEAPAQFAAGLLQARFPNWAQSTNASLIRVLLDRSAQLNARRQAALELARVGSDETLAALREALAEAPAYVKAMIAEGLGESSHPEATALIQELLQSPDEVTARGAVRGLETRGTPEAVQTLQEVLLDESSPDSVRSEAALALGGISRPESLAALSRALGEVDDPDLQDCVLKGLARQPFAQTEEMFQGVLQNPWVEDEMKVAALEALGASGSEAQSFLLGYAADTNPELRSAALWALASIEEPADISSQLLNLLKQEKDPEARAGIYSALKSQENCDVLALLEHVRAETGSESRLTALNTLAGECRQGAPEEALQYFDQVAVPELQSRALNAPPPQERIQAVWALSLAETDASRAAVKDVASKSSDPKVVQAADIAQRRSP